MPGPRRSPCTPPPLAGGVALSAGDADFDADPFYLVKGRRIPLVAEVGEFVVETESPSSSLALRQAASARGLAVSHVSSMGDRARYWLVGVADAQRRTPRAAAVLLRSDPNVRFAEPVYRSSSPGQPRFRFINRLVVQFRESLVPEERVREFMDAWNLELERPPLPDRGITTHRFRFRRDVAGRPLEVAVRLHGQPEVDWAFVDAYTEGGVGSAPSDPFYSLQYYLKNSQTLNGVPVDIGVEQAWDYTTGQGIKVGIFDSGVDLLFHPELAAGGYVAYDAVNDTVGFEPCAGSATQPPGSPFYINGHGTAVAGIVAAQHNGTGIAGIAPSAVLHVVRVLCTRQNGEVYFASRDNIADAFRYAARYWGTDVITNSWYFDDDDPVITAAVDTAVTFGRGGKGTVIVWMSGNQPAYPPPFASYLPKVLAVGAITATGSHADYSQGQDSLDLVAPSASVSWWGGGSVVTLDISGPAGINDGPGGHQDYTSTFAGTSAAAPQVAGAVALLLAREPTLSVAQVISRLRTRADPWTGAPGCNQFLCGYGKLNVFRTITNGTPVVTISGPSTAEPSGYCNFQASVQGGGSPYHYVWRKGQEVVGGDSPQVLVPVGSESFTLTVTLTDAFAQQSIDNRYVWVSWSAPPCQF